MSDPSISPPRAACEQKRQLAPDGTNGHPFVEVWLLDYGRDFEVRPRPADVELGVPKACFQNSAELALGGRYSYAEGFITLPNLPPLLIHHAWNVDEEGFVVESTLDEEGHHYFGVEIADVSDVLRVARETHSWGLLYKELGHELIEAL